MFILQTLKEFMDNPMGKGSNAIPSRQLIKDDLRKRLQGMLTEKEKKVEMKVYKDSSVAGNIYYLHLLIPSESRKRNNTYDVVLQLFVDENTPEVASDSNLNRYQVRFFSNSPSFVYTFLYAFSQYGLFVDSLKNKFKSISFDHPPITRNPGEVISYEKTITFAAIYLLLEKPTWMTKGVLDGQAKPFNKDTFNRKIRTGDQIELEIKKETMRVQREEKEEARKKSSTRRSDDIAGRGSVGKLDKVNTRGRITPIGKREKITPRKPNKSKIRPR